jgi:hypothetical protein
MLGERDSPGESSVIFERYEMTTYSVGDYIRIDGRCDCVWLARPDEVCR